jgi:hypothetical protein
MRVAIEQGAHCRSALWLCRGIEESKSGEETNERRRAARAKKMSGAALTAEDHALGRFTFADLFAETEARKRTIQLFMMLLTATPRRNPWTAVRRTADFATRPFQ